MISVGSKSNTNNQEIDLGLSDKSDPNEQGDLFGNIFLSINVKQENEISLEKNEISLEKNEISLELDSNAENKTSDNEKIFVIN